MFEQLVKRIIKGEKARGRIDVSFVSGAKMRALNRKYRNKDKSTDVLSFTYGEGKILGDVFITEKEKRLVIHGTLHVLGYDHGRKMSDAEKIYAQF
jgi:probable rRNA maturation factor